MNWRQRLMAMGVYDRLLSLYSGARNRDGTYTRGQIGTDHIGTHRQVLALSRELGLSTRYAREALMTLADEARKAANAARRFQDRPGNPATPPLSGLPCPENPGGRCGGRIEVAGWVIVVDPATGTQKRVPFVIVTDEPMTRTDIASAAGRMALADVVARGYDAGGRIDPATATTEVVIIGSITGRD